MARFGAIFAAPLRLLARQLIGPENLVQCVSVEPSCETTQNTAKQNYLFMTLGQETR